MRRRKQKKVRPHGDISRRDFLGTTGLGIAGLATVGSNEPLTGEDDGTVEPGSLVPVTLRINGREYRLLTETRWSLGYILRERLGLTGTKLSCERGECGACTVLMDGMPRYACMVLAPEAEGIEIVTVEGLLHGEDLGNVQRAFVETDALQCGYCTPGQIMAVEGLLRTNADPDINEIRRGVSGNLCRCGAYVNIFKAARKAAEERLKSGTGG